MLTSLLLYLNCTYFIRWQIYHRRYDWLHSKHLNMNTLENILISDMLMVIGRVMFSKIFFSIISAFVPIDQNMFFVNSMNNPGVSHIPIFTFFAFKVLLINAAAVKFLVFTGVGGCEWLSAANIWRKGIAAWPFANKTPDPPSVADNTTCFNNLQRTRTCALSCEDYGDVFVLLEPK